MPGAGCDESNELVTLGSNLGVAGDVWEFCLLDLVLLVLFSAISTLVCFILAILPLLALTMFARVGVCMWGYLDTCDLAGTRCTSGYAVVPQLLSGALVVASLLHMD